LINHKRNRNGSRSKYNKTLINHKKIEMGQEVNTIKLWLIIKKNINGSRSKYNKLLLIIKKNRNGSIVIHL